MKNNINVFKKRTQHQPSEIKKRKPTKTKKNQLSTNQNKAKVISTNHVTEPINFSPIRSYTANVSME